jgi:hypothetical protein
MYKKTRLKSQLLKKNKLSFKGGASARGRGAPARGRGARGRGCFWSWSGSCFSR